MGGAQPLAVTMNGGVALCIDVDPARIERRLRDGYLDEIAPSLDDALEMVANAKRERRPLSVGVEANAAVAVPDLLRRGVEIDMVDRPDLGPRSAQRVYPRRADPRGCGGTAGQGPGRICRRGAAIDGGAL